MIVSHAVVTGRAEHNLLSCAGWSYGTIVALRAGQTVANIVSTILIRVCAIGALLPHTVIRTARLAIVRSSLTLRCATSRCCTSALVADLALEAYRTAFAIHILSLGAASDFGWGRLRANLAQITDLCPGVHATRCTVEARIANIGSIDARGPDIRAEVILRAQITLIHILSV